MTPGTDRVCGRQRLALGIVLAVALLAGVNWLLSPEQALRWLRAMLTLPALLLVLSLWHLWILRTRRTASDDDRAAISRYFGAALTLAFVAVGIRQITLSGLEIWVALGGRDGDLEIERRILGLAAAVVFVVLGNALPKILTPLAMLPLDLAERVTRARRFVGAAWIVIGLVMAFAFLSLPLELAQAAARWGTLAGILAVLGAIVWMNLGPARREG